jgi:ComF family protein
VKLLRSIPSKNLVAAAVDLLFPKHCLNCGDPFRDGLSNILCAVCWCSISPYEGSLCCHCGASLPPNAFDGTKDLRCKDCGFGEYELDEVRSLGPYEGPLRIVHHSFKFEGLEGLAVELAAKMAKSVPKPEVDNLVPVPMNQMKERERGYDPVKALSSALTREWGIPTQKILTKIKLTPPQMSLKQKERLTSPKGAFAIELGVRPPQRIILVDDVFTTGSTLEECARVLKKGGAQWVGAVVWGRTPKNFSF